MEGGLRSALLLLLVASQSLGLQYAVTSFTTTNTAFLLNSVTLTTYGKRTVTLLVSLGFYNYIYTYTEPFTTAFVLSCSGSLTLGFLTPTVVATASLLENVVSNVTVITRSTTVSLSLPSQFYYLLGGTSSTSDAVVIYQTLDTTVLSVTTATGVAGLTGTALVVPKSYLVCAYSPAPEVTVALLSGTKATLEEGVTTVSSAFLAEASYPLGLTVVTSFPISASVNGTVVEEVYRFVFHAPEPKVEEAPALALTALAFISFLKRKLK